MLSDQYVFTQLMAFLPKPEFRGCVQTLSRRSPDAQLLLSRSISLHGFRSTDLSGQSSRHRDLPVSDPIQALSSGDSGRVSRSTLADANEKRDWQIYADFAQALIGHARTLYAAGGFGVDLEHTANLLDSTTIDLCLSFFPGPSFAAQGCDQAAYFDGLAGQYPVFRPYYRRQDPRCHPSGRTGHRARCLLHQDRGYIDFLRLYAFTRDLAFFVIRAKRNMDYSRRCYRPVDKSTGFCAATKRSSSPVPRRRKPTPFPWRRVSFCDPETEKRFVFLSNNFILPALTIARIYKCRWQVELFFKWIKQNLRIKTFYGTSPNAVKTQVWIAISVYVLVAIVRKELKLDKSPGEILQILSITLCEKTPIFTVLSGQSTGTDDSPCCNQLPLFDF